MNHATLAPSAAHKWINCPPSARLEEQFPDTVSTAALEGTFAHKLAETFLQNFFEFIPAEIFKIEYEKLKSNKFFSRELEEYVETYTAIVTEKFIQAKAKDKGAAVLLEQKVDLSEYVPKGYGHADAIIISDGVMEICDLKYGAGVKVDAKNNPQLRLYALGAYSELNFLYDIKSLTVTIIQPRNGGISSENILVTELLDWGEKIKKIAELAFKGEGEFKAGEHCKFCRAAMRCKTYADYQLEVVKNDFDDPDLLSDAEISKILSRADSIIKWLGNVKDFALKEAVEKNRHWAGFKLVEGRSVRKIIDEQKAADILRQNGADDSEIYKPKEILGITALEKNFGKKKIAELLGGVIQKPPGAPVLVEESDKRAEWHNAETDFDNIEKMEKNITTKPVEEWSNGDVFYWGLKTGRIKTYHDLGFNTETKEK